jgi:hypothetical protein
MPAVPLNRGEASVEASRASHAVAPVNSSAHAQKDLPVHAGAIGQPIPVQAAAVEPVLSHAAFESSSEGGAIAELRHASHGRGLPPLSKLAVAATPQRVQPKKTEITHRASHPTSEVSHPSQPSVVPFARSGSGSGIVQRAPITPAASAPAPTLPNAGGKAAPGMPPREINQLANRVYDLLVRRLAVEKQRKGV